MAIAPALGQISVHLTSHSGPEVALQEVDPISVTAPRLVQGQAAGPDQTGAHPSRIDQVGIGRAVAFDLDNRDDPLPPTLAISLA